MKRRQLFLMLLCVLLPVVFACSNKQKIDKQAQLNTMLRQFFSVPAAPATPNGLWLADQSSVIALIEKKYLASYVAKPDEKQADEIRERLKSLRIFFRVQNDSVQMLTVSADSFGTSTGNLKPRPLKEAGVQIFDAVMRGKSSSLRAVFRLRSVKAGEKLEYEEGGQVLTAARETRTVDQLVTHYMAELGAATGLPQY